MAYFTKEDVKNINALVISLVVFAIFALGFWLGGVDWFVTRNEEAGTSFFISVLFAARAGGAARQ
ncbi:hypothetical protein SIPHO035v1_p0142 [Vibrio phage 234P7B]|nr:hypothetical protein SIPHO035v1_p0142 [Vibrio phage 234P7B]